MPVRSDSYRVDPSRYQALLDRAYGAAPGPAGAAVILSLVQEQYGRMMGLYEQSIHIPKVQGSGMGASRFVRRKLQRLFRPWHKRALAFGQRLDGYWSDACLPASPCPDAPQPEYTTEWVADPLLLGRWPDTYYLGVETPKRADAIELAGLWNELVAVDDVLQNIGDSPDQLAAEMLETISTELRRSLPGEPETWRDSIDDGLDELRGGLGEIWEGAKAAAWYIGAAAAVVVAALAYKATRK